MFNDQDVLCLFRKYHKQYFYIDQFLPCKCTNISILINYIILPKLKSHIDVFKQTDIVFYQCLIFR